jgi:hypothetical protein
MEAADARAATCADADTTLSAAATEAAAATDRDRDDNGLEEVKRMMAEVKSAKPKYAHSAMCSQTTPFPLNQPSFPLVFAAG